MPWKGGNGDRKREEVVTIVRRRKKKPTGVSKRWGAVAHCYREKERSTSRGGVMARISVARERKPDGCISDARHRIGEKARAGGQRGKISQRRSNQRGAQSWPSASDDKGKQKNPLKGGKNKERFPPRPSCKHRKKNGKNGERDAAKTLPFSAQAD